MDRDDDLIGALLRGETIENALPLDRVEALGASFLPARSRVPDAAPEPTDRASGGEWPKWLGTDPESLPDLAWCGPLLVEYWARWPDRNQPPGQRYLGSLALDPPESRALVDRVGYVVRTHAPLTIARFQALTGSTAGWQRWVALFTLAVVELAYAWNPGDGERARFWEMCLREFGDSDPSDGNHQNAARRFVDEGFDVWGVRRAAADTYQYVTTALLQSGIPTAYLPAFRKLLEATRDEYGWDRLARESAGEVARLVCAVGRQRWPSSLLRHLLGGQRGWETPEPVAGEMIQGLARLARFCERAGRDVRALTASELERAIAAGAGAIAHFRDWRRLAAVLRPAAARAAPRSSPWLAWSPDDGIVCVLPGQQVDVEGTDPDALVLRVGDARVFQEAIRSPSDAVLDLPDRQERVSRLDGEIVWELLDGRDQVIQAWRVPRIGRGGCAFLALDPRRETVVSEPQRLRNLSEVIFLGPCSTIEAIRWPPGVVISSFAGRVGVAGWVGIRAARSSSEVSFNIGDHTCVWYDSATEPRLCGWRATPERRPIETFLEPPLLWLPPHLANGTVLVDGWPLPADAVRTLHDDESVSIVLAARGRVDVHAAHRTTTLRWEVVAPDQNIPPPHPRWTLVSDGEAVRAAHLRDLAGADVDVEGLWPGDALALVACDRHGKLLQEIPLIADRFGRAQAGLLSFARALRQGDAAAIILQGRTWSGSELIAGQLPAGPGSPVADAPPSEPAEGYSPEGYAPPDLVARVARLAASWNEEGRPLAVRRATLVAAVQDALPPPLMPSEEQVLAAIAIALDRGELALVPDGYVATARPRVVAATSGEGFATGHPALAHWLAETRLGEWSEGLGGDPAGIHVTTLAAGDQLRAWCRVVALEEAIERLPPVAWPRDPGQPTTEPFPAHGWEYLDPFGKRRWVRLTPTTRAPLVCLLRGKEGFRAIYRWWENGVMRALAPTDVGRIRWLIGVIQDQARVVAVPASDPASAGWYVIQYAGWLPREHWILYRRATFPTLDRGRLVPPRQLPLVRRLFQRLHARLDGLDHRPGVAT